MGDPPNSPEPDSASERGLILLNAMCRALLDCQLALEVLSGEVDMNFDELLNSLVTAQIEAGRAYKAADLLFQVAALGEKWGHLPSRPKAVIARHSAAVKAGAVRVIPRQSQADELIDNMNHHESHDAPPGERPRCAAASEGHAQQCGSRTIYLGEGQWAPNCYVHSPTAERRRYKEHATDVAEVRARHYEELKGAVVQRWLMGPAGPDDLPGQNSTG
jgi:hypothetical protein